MRFHSRPKHVSTLLFVFGIAVGCASASEKGTGSVSTQGLGDSGYHFALLDGSVTDAGGADAGQRLNPLCGTGICGGEAPDNPLACNEHEVGADGSFNPDAGATRPSSSDASIDASSDAAIVHGAGGGHDIDASVTDASVSPRKDSGVRASADGGRPVLPSVLSCQVSSGDQGPLHGCAVSGLGDVASACASSHDCKPALACVGTGSTGQCLPYCCDSRTVCSAGTFCAARPLIDGQEFGLQVPVCAPASQCTLDQPCKGSQCCPNGNACTIVLSDGTTGCVTPGTGRDGAPCGAGGASSGPCAAGYFCSVATSACVKICKTSAEDLSCAPGKCQAEAGFPVGFGLCIGPTPAAE